MSCDRQGQRYHPVLPEFAEALAAEATARHVPHHFFKWTCVLRQERASSPRIPASACEAQVPFILREAERALDEEDTSTNYFERCGAGGGCGGDDKGLLAASSRRAWLMPGLDCIGNIDSFEVADLLSPNDWCAARCLTNL